jgi:hypothetical protein
MKKSAIAISLIIMLLLSPFVFGETVTMIVVHLNRQKLFAFEGKKLLASFDCVTGRDGRGTTRVGVFRVYRKDKDHRSSKYGNAPMPYSMFFDGGRAIHGTSWAIPRSYLTFLPGTHGWWGLEKSLLNGFLKELEMGL